MRQLKVAISSTNPEAYTKTSQQLVEEMGEPILAKKNALVKAEPNALDKLKGLQESGR